jgi:hypothetical protein
MEGIIMNTSRKLITGTLGAVLFTAASAFAATPGQGFDAFGARDYGSGIGESTAVASPAYMGTSLGGIPGKGWDAFNARQGERVPDGSSGYIGTSMVVAPSGGYDLLGSKDPSL